MTALPNTPGITRHILALDGLRGTAILMVMLFHYHVANSGPGWAGTTADRIAGSGGNGVNLFFVLSGFLITGILLDAKNDAHYLRTFYARRFLRIFPLYYAALFGGLILLPWLHPISDPTYSMTVQHQVWLWTYTSNFYESWSGRALPLYGHFWSLAVEEQFYLLWPFVVLWSGRRTLMMICAGCFLAAFLCRLVLLEIGANPALAVLRLSPCQLDSLATGAFLALLLRKPEQTDAGTRKLFAQRIFILSMIVVTSLVFFYTELVDGRYLLMALCISCWSIFFGVVLFSAVTGSSNCWLRHFFESPVLRVAGKYSYGLYVFHWPVGRLWLALMEKWREESPESMFHQPLIFQVSYFLLATTSSMLLAWLSWHLYEKQFLRLKRYFEYEQHGIKLIGIPVSSAVL